MQPPLHKFILAETLKLVAEHRCMSLPRCTKIASIPPSLAISYKLLGPCAVLCFTRMNRPVISPMWRHPNRSPVTMSALLQWLRRPRNTTFSNCHQLVCALVTASDKPDFFCYHQTRESDASVCNSHLVWNRKPCAYCCSRKYKSSWLP